MKAKTRFPLRSYSSALALALAATAFAPLSACGDEPATLPADYNTGRYRQVGFDFVNKATGDTANVLPLNGMDGSPLGIVSGDQPLTTQLWGRTSTSPPGPDGAHVRVVRVGTDSLCDLSLSGIFPNATADTEDPANYDFTALDAHVAAVEDLNTARVMWQAAFKPGEACNTNGGIQTGSPIANQAEADRYADVAYNTMRHLRSPGTSGVAWDQASKAYKVTIFEFGDDPVGQMGYPSNASDPSWNLLFNSYANVAGRIKTEWPDQIDDQGNPAPRVYVGGMSFTLSNPDDVKTGADKHPIIAFIDYCKNNNVPLDNLSFKTKTATPRESFRIAEKLREYLITKQLSNVKLTLTGFEPDYSDPEVYGNATVLDDPQFKSAHLGAFQTAVRILSQDVPVTWALAGRTHRVYPKLAQAAAGQMAVDSLYFDESGTAQPAFMAMYPFRQVVGHQRFQLTPDSGTDAGFVLMASNPTSSDNSIHIIIANANVGDGQASMTYDLRVKTWVLPGVKRVDYRLATLDRNSKQELNNTAQQGFFFGETGSIDTTDGAGFIRFVHEMAVPSVHYLTLTKSQ